MLKKSIVGACIVSALFLVGCAITPTPLPVDNLAASDQTQVENQCPAEEGTSEIFSLWVSSARYGYARAALDITNPTAPRLFAHYLQEKYGTNPVPPTQLRHFAVYANNRAEAQASALGAAIGGGIGALIATSGISRSGDTVSTLVNSSDFDALSGDDEYKRAFYTELPKGTSAYVVYIESESGGKNRFTRTVTPIKTVQIGEKIPLHQALDAAIKFHLNY